MKNVSEVLVDKIIENLIENNSIDIADVEVYKFGVETSLLKALPCSYEDGVLPVFLYCNYHISFCNEPNRKLGSEDIDCFRHRLKIISLVFLITYVVTTGLGAIYLIKLYTIGLTMVTLLTILGKLQSIRQN